MKKEAQRDFKILLGFFFIRLYECESEFQCVTIAVRVFINIITDRLAELHHTNVDYLLGLTAVRSYYGDL